MAFSAEIAASSYLHDRSPDMSSSLASYRIRDSGGGRDLGDVHVPPSSRKYRVTSATKAEIEHDELHIETTNEYPSSSRLIIPSTSWLAAGATSSLAASSATSGTSPVLGHKGSNKSASKTVRIGDSNASNFNADTQHSLESGRTSGSTDKSSSEYSGKVQTEENANRNWREWKRLHRIVEQMDDEPCCIIIFKWLLIIVGIGMLGAVIEIMGEVLYSWFAGNSEHDVDQNETISDNATYLARKNDTELMTTLQSDE